MSSKRSHIPTFPHVPTIDEVLNTTESQAVLALHNRMGGQGKTPLVPYVDVLAFPATLGIDVRCIISSTLTEQKYIEPSHGQEARDIRDTIAKSSSVKLRLNC